MALLLEVAEILPFLCPVQLSWKLHLLVNLGNLSKRLCVQTCEYGSRTVVLLELLGVVPFGSCHWQGLTKSSVHTISANLGCLHVWVKWTYYTTPNVVSMFVRKMDFFPLEAILSTFQIPNPKKILKILKSSLKWWENLKIIYKRIGIRTTVKMVGDILTDQNICWNIKSKIKGE